jgi:putative DNA primase/helicase
MARAPLPPIKFKALADALQAQAKDLVPKWIRGGFVRGSEYVCGSLSGDEGDSCAINLETGLWADFAGTDRDRGSDLVSLYAAIHEITMAEAAIQLADEHDLHDLAGIVKRPGDGAPRAPRPPPPPPPPPAPAQREKEQWETRMPAPADAPPATFWHYSRKKEDILHTASYWVEGQLFGYVVRFRTSDGGKVAIPYTWAASLRDGSMTWKWRGWDDARPLFYPGGAHPGGRTVIVVEGEVKAEVLQALLDARAPGVYCVVGWPGGCNGWKKAQWEWLAGSTVLLWPDCDSKREKAPQAAQKSVVAQAMKQLEELGGEIADSDRKLVSETALQLLAQSMPYLPARKQPGMAAMLGIGTLLSDTQGCTVSMLPIPGPGELPDGWDCHDAIDMDGWDYDRVLTFFGRAQPLQADTHTVEPAAASSDASAASAGGGGSGGSAPKSPAGAGDGDDEKLPWWLKPYWDAEKGRWLVSRKLVIAALLNDEALNGVLGLNQLSNNIDARRPWPWPHAKAGPITGAVDLLLGRYLSKTYGLPSINRAALMEAIETVAHENPFHPVQEYLTGLPEPDPNAKPLIDKWLVFVIGETPETLKPEVFEYLCLVGRYWLLGMVNRIMEPGCKFDYCPVLEGPGGMRKSTMVETLASSAYFSDTHFDVSRGKEGQEQVQGLWLYEIAELANFGKSEINIIKAFISAKVDRYRPSYGRVVEAYARQCVLAGTTNERTYLRDRTGNRRFWPVPVRHVIDIEWLLRNRDRLFAEAFALYLQAEPFTPAISVEERLFFPMQESRLVETAVLSELLHVLTRPPMQTGIGAVVNELTTFVTISQLTAALGVDAAKSNASLEGQIRSWMEHEGWERCKKQQNGVRAWGYEKPKDWPPYEPEEGDAVPPPPPAPKPVANEYGDADDAPF